MTGPRMRAGDADRQAAVDRLTEHLTAGRLDLTEFDQRVAKAYAATYLDEFPALFTDLPDLAPPPKGGRGGHGQDRNGFATATPWTPAGGYPGSPGGMSGRPGRYPAPPGRPSMPGGMGAGRFWRAIIIAILVLAAIGLVVQTRGFILFPLIFIGMGMFRGGRRGGPWARPGRPPWR